MYYSAPMRLPKARRARVNLSYGVNVISVGSPSRIRIVRRISLGMTTLPRSSILLTIPVAFISIKTSFASLLCFLCKYYCMEFLRYYAGIVSSYHTFTKKSGSIRKIVPDFLSCAYLSYGFHKSCDMYLRFNEYCTVFRIRGYRAAVTFITAAVLFASF